MSKKIKSNRVINGSFGSAWINNEKWLDVEEFEAKVTIDYEDVNMAEDLATHKKMVGWTGEGNLKVKKVYSRGANLLAEAVKKGVIPEINIVGKLADPDAFGTERIAINEVTFSEFMLMQFAQKTIGTEELPFSFADYDLIDSITA
ncbi:phage tail tube protein [Lysinibacillus capsici]|uniref:phage tail tube protein n=1 Tax=Lysinibacillus TaxID=400634 RepID=UPI0024813EE9|nr:MULTISPECIES: phage tail tube protein [Lysinibacillus]WGT38245.1 phage tail tube protein [Lysinibacillus sp. 1 U-2021]WNN76734.1 phage tail tube protein [Lysinibacillus capsici]